MDSKPLCKEYFFVHVYSRISRVEAAREPGQLDAPARSASGSLFFLPANPSLLLWLQESDIVTCLSCKKDGLLPPFIFPWIITLSFFIWLFIKRLKCFSFCAHKWAASSFIICTGPSKQIPSAILPFTSPWTLLAEGCSNSEQLLLQAIALTCALQMSP